MKTDKSKTKTLALLFVLLLSFTQTVEAVDSVASLKRFEGTWSGDGKLMGNSARLELKWEWVLNGKFCRLSLKNESTTASGQRQVFEGHAYYEPNKDGSVSAVWFDSRGVTFGIKGKFEGDTLTANWENGQEQGKSTYRLVDASTLEVIDSVQQKDGTYRPFGTAVLRRQ